MADVAAAAADDDSLSRSLSGAQWPRYHAGDCYGGFGGGTRRRPRRQVLLLLHKDARKDESLGPEPARSRNERKVR